VGCLDTSWGEPNHRRNATILRLAGTAARHPRRMIAVWGLVVAASFIAAPVLFSSLTSDMGGGDGSESSRADDRDGIRTHDPLLANRRARHGRRRWAGVQCAQCASTDLARSGCVARLLPERTRD
jgi:hypothetical protein